MKRSWRGIKNGLAVAYDIDNLQVLLMVLSVTTH